MAGSMLWREISPLGHHRRYFYDDRQHLLYSSEGYSRKNLDDESDTAQHDHPRDNFNNLFRSYVWDDQGNLIQDIDANGLVTARTDGENSRPLTVYPGQAHYGLGGDWRQHFGEDGFLFCAHHSDSSDLESLPDYVSAITPGASVVATNSNLSADNLALLSTQVLEGQVGRWTSETQSLDFQIQLTANQAFNLSLYTHSLDQLTDTDQALD